MKEFLLHWHYEFKHILVYFHAKYLNSSTRMAEEEWGWSLGQEKLGNIWRHCVKKKGKLKISKPNQMKQKNTSRVIYSVYNIIWYFFKFIYHMKLLLFFIQIVSYNILLYFGDSNFLLSLTSFFTLLTLLYTLTCFFKIHALFLLVFIVGIDLMYIHKYF